MRIVVILILLSSPAHGQGREILYPIALGASFFDAHTTRVNIKNGAAETNPIMRPFVGRNDTLYGIHAGLAAFAVETSLWARRSGARRWWIPIVVHVGTHVGAGLINRRVRP